MMNSRELGRDIETAAPGKMPKLASCRWQVSMWCSSVRWETVSGSFPGMITDALSLSAVPSKSASVPIVTLLTETIFDKLSWLSKTGPDAARKCRRVIVLFLRS